MLKSKVFILDTEPLLYSILNSLNSILAVPKVPVSPVLIILKYLYCAAADVETETLTDCAELDTVID